MRMSAGSTVLVLAMWVAMNACTLSNTMIVDDVLVETPHGAVFLQHAEDGWFRTAHPFDLSSSVLATVFRGVRVQVSSTETIPWDRVFSDEDTEFLSPLMSTALSKATKRQVVGFRVVHELDGRQETTGGILYVQGRLLHLTLTQYRAQHDRSESGGTAARLHPNPTGLNQQQIKFSPETAKRSSRHEQPDVTVAPPLISLVLDYGALIEGVALPLISIRAQPIRQGKTSLFQQILEPAFPTTGSSTSDERQTPSPDESHTIQVPSSGKDGELDALKEEVRRLQRRLSELEGDTQGTKQPEPWFRY